MSVNDRQVGGSHYASKLQHWDLIELHGIGYLEGCATKYITRWRKKNGRQDLEKALHYVQKLASLHPLRGPRGSVPTTVLHMYQQANKLTQLELEAITILCSKWNREGLAWAETCIQQLLLQAKD